MTRDKIKTKIIQILSDYFATSNIDEDTKLIENLGADSLDLLDLAVQLENEFSILLSEVDKEDLLTVGNIINFLEDET